MRRSLSVEPAPDRRRRYIQVVACSEAEATVCIACQGSAELLPGLPCPLCDAKGTLRDEPGPSVCPSLSAFVTVTVRNLAGTVLLGPEALAPHTSIFCISERLIASRDGVNGATDLLSHRQRRLRSASASESSVRLLHGTLEVCDQIFLQELGQQDIELTALFMTWSLGGFSWAPCGAEGRVSGRRFSHVGHGGGTMALDSAAHGRGVHWWTLRKLRISSGGKVGLVAAKPRPDPSLPLVALRQFFCFYCDHGATGMSSRQGCVLGRYEDRRRGLATMGRMDDQVGVLLDCMACTVTFSVGGVVQDMIHDLPGGEMLLFAEVASVGHGWEVVDYRHHD